MYKHTHKHSSTHTRTHTNTQAYMHACTQTYIHACTYTHTLYTCIFNGVYIGRFSHARWHTYKHACIHVKDCKLYTYIHYLPIGVFPGVQRSTVISLPATETRVSTSKLFGFLVWKVKETGSSMKDALATKTAPSGRAVSVTVNFWPLQTTSIGVSLRWVWCSDSMLKFTSVTSREGRWFSNQIH